MCSSDLLGTVTNHALVMRTNATERMRIDTGGNIGINMTPVGTYNKGLYINSGSGQFSGIQICNDTTGTSSNKGFGIYINNNDSNLWNFGNGPLVLATNNTERMRVNAGAPVLCLAGGSTSATGTGIAFPATQSASSDANTLDDYEEGTWTPTYSGSTSGTGTHTQQNGY